MVCSLMPLSLLVLSRALIIMQFGHRALHYSFLTGIVLPMPSLNETSIMKDLRIRRLSCAWII
jgi:hypothetical protein